MGFDELKAGEAHEISIQMKGPCSKAKAKAYKAALRDCLRKLAQYGARRSRLLRHLVPDRTARRRRR